LVYLAPIMLIGNETPYSARRFEHKWL